MPLHIDEAEENREYELQAIKLRLVEKDREAHRKHELALIKAKTDATRAGKRSISRIEAVQRVLLALVKLPTIPFVLGLIRLYKKDGEATPQYLIDYLNL